MKLTIPKRKSTDTPDVVSGVAKSNSKLLPKIGLYFLSKN